MAGETIVTCLDFLEVTGTFIDRVFDLDRQFEGCCG